MNNHWIALEDTLFAEWEAEFTPPFTTNDVENILKFATGLLKAGEVESVYRIKQTHNSAEINTDFNSMFAQLWKKMWENYRILPLFDLRIDENLKLLSLTGGRICYYDKKGNINESEVGNIGKFLRMLHTEIGDNSDSFMDDVNPVTIISDSIHKKNMEISNKLPQPIIFNVSLGTDIWFPKILGLRNYDQPPFPHPPKWYDNRELAFCHTPRLNRFLSKVHQLTLDYGGQWKLNPPEGIAEHYASMVRENRIIL